MILLMHDTIAEWDYFFLVVPKRCLTPATPVWLVNKNVSPEWGHEVVNTDPDLRAKMGEDIDGARWTLAKLNTTYERSNVFLTTLVSKLVLLPGAPGLLYLKNDSPKYTPNVSNFSVQGSAPVPNFLNDCK